MHIDNKEEFDELTAQEADLIRAVRNYRAAYPNGSKELKRYIRQMLAEMLNP